MEKKSKIATLASAIALINTSYSLGKDLKAKYDASKVYSAKIPANAYVHGPLMQWLNDNTSSRSIEFDSRYRGVSRLYDSDRTAKVVIKGHPFNVSLAKPDMKKGAMPSMDDDFLTFAAGKIVFTTENRKAIDALHEFLEELTNQRKVSERNIYVWTPASYNGWQQRDLPERPLESVFLPEGVKEDLVFDLKNFFENEDHYNRIGIPWHRGYLLYGPPGNGKTSLVSAIASDYRMHLFNLPLSAVKDDKELSAKINEMSPRSILLLEDIDIFSKSMTREQKDGGPTLAGLLNALDGVSTPHGMVTFMTTNAIETLDEALIRAGRIDKRLELLPPNSYQVEGMFQHAFGEPLGVKPKEFKNVADLTEVFKRFTLDPESARMEIKAED